MCLATVIVLAVGCGDGKKKLTTVEVKGSVTLDGKPMHDGEIYFILAGQAPTQFEVKDGAFSGKANAGKNKVEIRSYKVGPPLTTDPENKPTKTNFIPDRFNATTTLEEEVKVGGSNDFKFDVVSK
jgi:hypothetical protein